MDDLQRSYNKLLDDHQKLSDKCLKLKEECKIYRDRNKVKEILVEKTSKYVLVKIIILSLVFSCCRRSASSMVGITDE